MYQSSESGESYRNSAVDVELCAMLPLSRRYCKVCEGYLRYSARSGLLSIGPSLQHAPQFFTQALR